MIGNYYTFRLATESLRPLLSGSRIRSLFTQDRDQLVMSLEGHAEHIVFSCLPEFNALYRHDGFVRSRRNTLDVLKQAHGRIIEDIRIHPSDRIVTLPLQEGVSLEARFFGAAANVLIIEPGERIVDTFRRPSPKRPNEPRERTDVRVTDAMNSLHSLAQSGNPVSVILKSTYRHWGKILVDEAMHRAGLSDQDFPDERTLNKLSKAIEELQIELEHPRPRVYFAREGKAEIPAEFSIVTLGRCEGMRERLFDDVHEAIRFYYARTSANWAFGRERSSIQEKIEAMLLRTGRSLDSAEREFSASDRGEEYERFGRLILSNVASLQKGVPVARIAEDNSIVEIPLSPELTPVQNAQKYFDKGKRSRAARDHAKARVAELAKHFELLERLSAGISEVDTREGLDDFMSKNKADLDQIGIGRKGTTPASLPFRTFTVEGGFEVWAGKNSASNDLLTLRHSRPSDLWFHARGAGGSHVVLKMNTGKGTPGKRAIHQAASVAAYYSRMRKAKLVPVAMTERKHVRKPRGAPPGSVVIEREEVILVEPRLPA